RLKWTSRLYRVLLARTHGVEAAAAFTPVMACECWPGMPVAQEGKGVVVEKNTAGEVPDAGERAPPG
ncbi:MAG: hypothetical protein KDH09_16300, partial [Chrysiogenetes bacterium]|nr:hypothetical protein [Chrysiogenetes bacterium]